MVFNARDAKRKEGTGFGPDRRPGSVRAGNPRGQAKTIGGEPFTAVHLHLVRHGATQWNRSGRYQGWSDPPLSPAGGRQVRRAAAILSAIPLAAVYTSDLRRASATAWAIRGAQPLPPPPLHRTPCLREINFGLWEGLTYDEIEGRWGSLVRRWYDDPAASTPPGGEAFSCFRHRVLAAVLNIIDAHPGADVAVVTHGGVINFLLATFEGLCPRAAGGRGLAPGDVRSISVDVALWLRLQLVFAKQRRKASGFSRGEDVGLQS